MAPKQFWADMTWRDFQSADMREVIAILPVAAVEQHGPHLPVGVDSVINEGYILHAAAAIPDDLRVLFLPVQPIGVSVEHGAFPGTLTLSIESAIRAWSEIGDGVARSGCRKLIVMSSHGGNGAAVEAVTLHLRTRWKMLAIHASWRRLGYPDGLFSAREAAHGVHGGDAETSLMLALRPALVRAAEVRDFPSAAEGFEKDFALLRAKPPFGFAWAAERSPCRWRGRRGRQGDGGKGRGGDRPWRRAVHRVASRRPGFRPRSAEGRAAGVRAVNGPHFEFEREAHRSGCRWVAGVDEVGRGPLAGPVGVAAVILDPEDLPEGLDDSKALPEIKRDALRPVIFAKAISVAVAFASAEEIDRYNIRGATLRVMARVVAALHVRPHLVLIDGRDIPDRLICPARPIIGGDALSMSIAAASIIAKTTRDALMRNLGLDFPDYGFGDHAGYATAFHRDALARLGPCHYHRRSFRLRKDEADAEKDFETV